MAKSEQFNISALGASEVPDIYCEPCHLDRHVVIAENYCVDCRQYLCGPCYKIYRRHKAFANHVLLDKDSMPLTTDPSRRVLDICEEKCPIHPNKVIELFCWTCDKVVCHICVATDHRRCERVEHIPEIVKYLELTKDFKKFCEDTMSTFRILSKQQKKIQASVTSIKEMGTLAKQELKRQRAEVNTFFDQLEKKMDEQITAIEKRNNDTLKAASNRLNHIKTEFDQIKNDIESMNTEHRCKLFTAMKRCQKKMKTFQDQFEKMQPELRIQHYTLVPSDQIQAMMRTTTEICRIVTARLESEIDIDTSTDKTVSGIASLTIMHGHYCVALDNNNKNIKVIDTKHKCVTSEITIKSHNIWAVTPVSDDQVAVSVELSIGRYQIQFFTVTPSGVLQRTKQQYDVNYYYFGMVHSAGNIYGVHGTQIDKLSMTGKTIRTIHYSLEGNMKTIATSPDGQTIYVTDDRKHNVTSMTLDGKVKVIYEDKDLKKPCITVDKHGYVYVSSLDTTTIQQLTADLHKVQDLIEDTCCSITYSSSKNKLYISDGNQIHQYSLDFK